MHISEILARKGGTVMTVSPDETLEAAAARMRIERVGALIVAEDGKRLRGLLSEKDIVHAIADKGPRALSTKVSEVMQRGVPVCRGSQTLASVARQMTEQRARHIPVVERGKIVGIVSVGDMLKDRLEEMALESAALRDLARSKALAG